MIKHNPLIIALDVSSSLKALNLVHKLKVTGAAFKIGFELFAAAGPKLVEKIVNLDVRVFLDLKFHDIPNTVAHAADVVTRMGVWMFNVHSSGGSDMMKRAKESSLKASGKAGIKPPLLLGVTVLTSLSDLSEINILLPIEKQVIHLSQLAKNSGLDGVVASAKEAAFIREKCGKDFCIVTPGIRLPNQPSDDQRRTLTPQEAMTNGSNYLVVGRPILESKKPLQTIEKMLGSF